MKLIEKFYIKLVTEELERSTNHGVRITTPRTVMASPIEKSKFQAITDSRNIEIPIFLIKVYEQIKTININWVLSKNDQSTLSNFMQDPWLIKNYYEEAESWDYLNEIFMGNLYLPTIERLLGMTQNDQDGYFLVTSYIGLDPNSFYPIDYHSNRYTSLLRKEKNTIKDNVWLLDSEARKLFNMKISIEEYLNLAYQAKLFEGWPSVFINGKKSDSYELMKRFLPRLIPHVKLNLESFNIK